MSSNKEGPSQIIIGGRAVFNFLDCPSSIKISRLSPGLYNFEVEVRDSCIVENEDLIIKWSENKKYKTIFKVFSRVSISKNLKRGKMRDVIYFKEITKTLKKAVEASETATIFTGSRYTNYID